MSLEHYLKITLTMITDLQVHVQLRGQGFGISHCDVVTDVQFTPAELSVAVRALEVNRALPETFDQAEWRTLREWNVVKGEFSPSEDSGEIKLREAEIDITQLRKRVQEKLFYTLFPVEDKEFEKQLEVALYELAKQENNKILHIRLEIPSKKKNELLHQLPWEVLCIKCEHFERHHVSIARYIQGVKPAKKAIPSEQARILVIRARPTGKEFDFIQLATDRDSIWQIFRDDHPAYRVRLKQLPDIKNVNSRTELLLSDYLNEQEKDAHISQFLHFECHGKFGRLCLNRPPHVWTNVEAEKCGCGANLSNEYYGYLALEYIESNTPEGDTWVHWFSADDLADLLGKHPINFVFLNTCDSAVARRSKNAFNGIAQALIQAGIPAVLGTPFRVESEAARKFAQYFYHHLHQTGSLIDALDYARQRLVNDPSVGREWYRFALYFGHQAELSDQLFVEKPSKDLSGQDFSGKDMSDESLCGWNLENANLLNANLSNSLLKGVNLREANLVGATFSGVDFSHADLTGANLENADLVETTLVNTKLVNTNLSGARFFKFVEDEEIAASLKSIDFSGAILSNSIFTNTKLSAANFKRSTERATNLMNADFSGAELFDVNFDQANLANAIFNNATFNTVSFRRANLVGADFQNVDFDKVKEVDFSGADLTDIQVNETFSFGKIIYDSHTKLNAYFEKVERVFSKQDSPGIDLAGTVHLKKEDLSRLDLDLSRANFCGADLRGANLSQINLQGADLSHTKLRGASLYKAKLNRANLSKANFYDSDNDDSDNQIAPDGVDVELCGADLQGADLSEAILYSAQLSGANLQGAKFIQSELIQANFTRANLKSAIMTDADLSGANLIMVDLNGANLRGANLQSAKLIRSDLTGTQLQGANLNRANLYGAILGDINLEKEAFDLSGAILPDGTKIPDDTEDVGDPVEELETI